MPRKKKKKGKKRRQRDTSDITKFGKLLTPKFIIKDDRTRKRKKTVIVDDRRRWHPEVYRRALTTSGTVAAITLRDKKGHSIGQSQTKAKVSFYDPKRTEVCRKRRNRREILFRLKKVGKGGSRVSRIRIRTPDSDVRCS